MKRGHKVSKVKFFFAISDYKVKLFEQKIVPVVVVPVCFAFFVVLVELSVAHLLYIKSVLK